MAHRRAARTDGPGAPDSDPGPIAGQLITREFEYDGGRPVTVYVPPDPPEAVVFAGDGELIAPWGRCLEPAGVVPTMIVGIHRTGDPDEMARLREYSPVFDESRFAGHERFVVDVVRPWIAAQFGVELPADRTAVAGVSASGELSLALGLRHPDVFGTVFSTSPGGGYRPPSPLPRRLPRTYLTAGRSEPFFLENAARWAEALRGAGAEVMMTEREGDHGDPFWQAEFPRMVAWAFGQRPARTTSRG